MKKNVNDSLEINNIDLLVTKKAAIKHIFTMQSIKYFVVSSILSLGQAIGYVAVIVLLSYIQNAANVDDPNGFLFPHLSGQMQIAILVPLLIFISLLSFLTGVFGNFYSIRFAKIISIKIRNLIYSKIQTFSAVDIEQFSQSSLINRLTIDITIIATGAEFLARALLKSFLLYFCSLVGMIIVVSVLPNNDGKAAIIGEYWIVISIVLLSLALIGIIGIVVLFSYKWFNLTQKNLDKINDLMQQNILGQRTVKSFNLQTKQFSIFDNSNEQLRYSGTRAQINMAVILPAIYFFLDLIIVVATWLSSPGMENKLLSIYLLMSVMIMALVLTIFGITQVSRAIPCFKRALQVITYKSSIIFPTKEAILSDKPTIKLNNVSFKYPNSEVYSLKKINLTINPQEVVGIIGSTGSGKTTLMNLLTRMYDVTNGEITLADTNIKNLTKHQLKASIAYCPQQVVLFEGTIKSNLMFADTNAGEEAMLAACELANLKDFVESLPQQLDYPITQRANNLSGGQKQRLSIARTLLKKSNFLFLDDATSALDMITERNICSQILENKKNQTVIISSQRISAIKNTDKILVMNNGEIIAEGKHLDLLKTCKYYYDIAVIQQGQKEVDNEINQ